MNRLGIPFVVVLFAGCGGSTPSPSQELNSKAPLGAWSVTAVEGAKNPGFAVGMTVNISKEEFSAAVGADKKLTGTMARLLPMKTPGQIDIQLGEDTWRGVYELNGDEATICFNAPGQQRPLDLAGSANLRLKLKRQ